MLQITFRTTYMLEQSSQPFRLCRLAGGGERGWYCMHAGKHAYVQLHLHECTPTTCSNGMRRHVLTCPSCKWRCAYTYTLACHFCGPVLKAQGPLVSHGLGVGDPYPRRPLGQLFKYLNTNISMKSFLFRWSIKHLQLFCFLFFSRPFIILVIFLWLSSSF